MIVRMAALVMLLAFGVTLQGADKPKSVIDQLRPGLTPAEVHALLGGPPNRIARQFLYRRHLELWTYDLPTPVLIEITFIRGEEPRVVRIHHTDK